MCLLNKLTEAQKHRACLQHRTAGADLCPAESFSVQVLRKSNEVFFAFAITVLLDYHPSLLHFFFFPPKFYLPWFPAFPAYVFYREMFRVFRYTNFPPLVF